MPDFSEQLGAALHDARGEACMEYKRRVYSRGEIADLADRAEAMLAAAGVPREASVGVVARNRPIHAAVMLGLIAAGRPLCTIYAFQSAEAIAAEVASLGLGAVIADHEDWGTLLTGAAKAAGSAGLMLNWQSAEPITHVAGLERAGNGPFRAPLGEPGLEILSSGTTGKPKRVHLPFRVLVRAVESVRASQIDNELPPDILTWPYGGIGGMCNLVASAINGRYTVLLEKFNVEEWVEAVRRLRPSYLTGPPAVARMVLDSKVTPDDIASVKYFYGGGAPFEPDLEEVFERTYGIVVIWAYGATEFCGTIISWTPELKRTFAAAKKGSMGRALPGIQLRIADVETQEILPAGRVGYLEGLVPGIGDGWIRTTDLALIDEDGFVFHHGRGDGAIFRGGFKIIPESVADVLRQHPAIRDAAVVGLPDQRLGQIPVAAVEIRKAMARPSEAELREFGKGKLTGPQTPVRILIVDALPRTPSLKVDLGAVRQLLMEA
jgi:acyl-coenzyme A synthetase/AMP-(fatty) acid ligase